MSETQPLVLSVVVSFDENDSFELLDRTLQAILTQEGRGERFVLPNVYVWCCGANASARKDEIGERTSIGQNVVLIESTKAFLCDLTEAVKVLGAKDVEGFLVLFRCGVVPKPQCLALVAEEMDDSVVVTARGFRLFPHRKLLSPVTQLERRVHYEYYSESHTSREVHVFTTDFLCLTIDVLRRIAQSNSENIDFTNFPHIWCSFLIASHLHAPIWKYDMRDILDLSSVPPPHTSSLVDASSCNSASFEEFYKLSYDSDWPRGVSIVNYSQEKLDAALKSRETCHEIWSRGFAGVNMLSEPASYFDIEAVVGCGVRVVRVGAVGGAQDLMYLLDPSSTNEDEDKEHFVKVLPRLRQSLTELGRHGLKIIITLADLPGSQFFSLPDDTPLKFWEQKELRLRVIKFWGLMAQSLIDLRHLIMGYDLINEPFTEEDRKVSFVDETPTSNVDILNDFYQETVAEIRKYDSDTIIILNPSRWGFPSAMTTIKPLPDPNVRYGVHCYYPPPLTLRRNIALKYPGFIPTYHKHQKATDTVLIDKSHLRQLFSHVVDWQKQHGVPAEKIVVAEFGMCREIPGAQEYLQDLVEIFTEFGWSWLLFSFRDEEWDALDYELGNSKSNMLYRSNCDLFHSISRYFR